MSVTVIYEFNAAEGRASELLQVLRQGRDFALGVSGCESFDVYQGEHNPNRFMMIETWTTGAAHREHFETNLVATGVLDKAIAVMAAPPDIEDPYVLRR